MKLNKVSLNCSLIRIGYHFMNGRLIWNNAVPENEVHINLGGDAGGGSFEMAFQIANLRHPNLKPTQWSLPCSMQKINGPISRQP